MKKLLTFLLVGLFMVGLSGGAGAAKWEKVALPEVFSVTVSVPEGFKLIEKEVLKEGRTTTSFSGPDGAMILVAKDAKRESLPEIFRGKFPLDSADSEKRAMILKEVGAQRSPKFIKLSNGHEAVWLSEKSEGLSMIMMIVPNNDIALSLVLIKRGDFTKDESTLADEIFSKVKF